MLYVSVLIKITYIVIFRIYNINTTVQVYCRIMIDS